MQCGLSNTLDRKGFWSTCILGIDIDEHLIGMVRKSIRHYCDQDIEVQEEFDVILALSITKWIHLNFVDDSLRLFFRSAYNHLLPGGRFIVEPQPFASYGKRSKRTERLQWMGVNNLQILSGSRWLF